MIFTRLYSVCGILAYVVPSAIAQPNPLFISRIPNELRFSDAGSINEKEEKLGKVLNTEGHPDRLTAALALWNGRSRPYSTDVLKYLAGAPQGGKGFRTFQREVEAALQPTAILKEIREGEYEWGAWLAFLRPHKDLTQDLLDALRTRPNQHPETILALGNSGDPKARDPLLELLKSKENRTAGDAAQALGYFGDPATEGNLIDALATDDAWRQVNACGALAKMGTTKAIPALEKVANDDRYTGALAVNSNAEYAIKAIKARTK
jgi:hypothetical protein